MSDRVKAQRCVIDNVGGVYGLDVGLRTPEQFDRLFSTDAPHMPSVAISVADCQIPPDVWVNAARNAFYNGETPGRSIVAACVAFLAAARAEAESGR